MRKNMFPRYYEIFFYKKKYMDRTVFYGKMITNEYILRIIKYMCFYINFNCGYK